MGPVPRPTLSHCRQPQHAAPCGWSITQGSCRSRAQEPRVLSSGSGPSELSVPRMQNQSCLAEGVCAFPCLQVMLPVTCLSRPSAAPTTTASPSLSRRHVSAPARSVGQGRRTGRRLGDMPPIFKVHWCCPLAASQLVTMHDLKHGLGPPGTAGARKLASSKYKLKVGAS